MELNKPSTSSVNVNKQKICKNLTLQQKLEAVKKKDAGIPTSKIAVEYNVNDSAVRRWVRNRDKLEKYSISSKSKRIRLSPVEKVNEALTAWYHDEKKRNNTITVIQVKAKALEFFKQFGDTGTFKASDGWLRTWKQRNGICFITNFEDQLSANTERANKFKDEVLDLIQTEQLTLNQIFNANETGLHFKMMPNRSLDLKMEHTAPGYKKVEDRLTIMTCCNANGSLKMPLLVVGQYELSQVLKKCTPQMLPVSYTNQRNTWISVAIFERWFKEQFVPHVCNFLRSKSLPEKAILLVGNGRTYSSTNILTVDGIKAIFFPPNVASLIQPLDHVIEVVRRRYKTKLLTFVINMQHDGMEYDEVINSFNIKNAIDLISNAWEDITEQTIFNCWKQLLNMPRDENESYDNFTSEHIQKMCKKIQQYENITLKQINDWICADYLPSLTDGEVIEIKEEPYNDKSGLFYRLLCRERSFDGR
nr:jerky protein homolog-like isoform X2 [Megalopta genalis]